MFPLLKRASLLVVMSALVGLAGCSSDAKMQDLQDDVEELKRRPGGQIEPLPSFVPYRSFTYSAMTLRAPFDPPSEDLEEVVLGKRSGVEPDLTREKEFLESFNIEALKMVGTLQRDGTVWALINDGQGGIHRITTGNYMGKNFGRVVEVADRQMDVVEIVPDGVGGWVERPKVIQITEKE